VSCCESHKNGVNAADIHIATEVPYFDKTSVNNPLLTDNPIFPS